MNYELHPLCTLFPRMSGAEFAALVDDIRANGQREPITLHDGMILDGGNRYRACIEAGIEPLFRSFDGHDIVGFVLSENLHRRHLTAGQHAAIVASVTNWANAQPRGRPSKGAAVHRSSVADRVALSGASVRTQKLADKVARASPELARDIGLGVTTLPKALAIVEAGKHQGKPKKGKKAEQQRQELREAQERGVSMLCSYARMTIKAIDALDQFTDEERQVLEDLRTAIDRVSSMVH